MNNIKHNHSVQYGYFHGRFQPFHLGHLHLIKTALQEVNELFIGITNPFRQPAEENEYIQQNVGASESLSVARAPENNPWTMWQRCLMIREGLRSEGIDLSRIIFIPNLRNTYHDIKESETCPPKEVTHIYLYGKDEHNKASEKDYKEKGYIVRSVPPEKSVVISATEVRRRWRENGNWESLVPKGTAQVIKMLDNLL